MRPATCLLLLLLAYPGLAYADGEASQLEDIRREIEQREAQARAYRDQADGLLGELDGIDRELSEVRHSVRTLRRHERAAQRDLVAAQARAAEAGQQRDVARKQLEARLVSLYKFSAVGGVRVLYSARDFQSFARGRRGLARILEQDRELLTSYRETAQAWRRERDASLALVADLSVARRELGAREGRVREMVVERRNAISLLRSRSRDELRAVHELEQTAERLERAIRQLPTQRFAGVGLERGSLSWPVDGSVRLRFGRQLDPEFGTETLRTGVEIAAKPGAPVRAVAPGKVLFAGWFRGFGQLVILDHGAGSVSVSGYLDELETSPGEQVAARQVIGRVGETGSVSGPGLYFEIRHESRPVDPLRWFAPR